MMTLNRDKTPAFCRKHPQISDVFPNNSHFLSLIKYRKTKINEKSSCVFSSVRLLLRRQPTPTMTNAELLEAYTTALNNGDITEYEIHPEDFGLTMASHRALRVDTPEESRDMVLAVLENQTGAPRDIVALNAGVALYAANVAPTMVAGIAMAQQALAQGLAKAKLAQLNEFTARHHAA